MGPGSLLGLPESASSGSGFLLRTSSPALWEELSSADLVARATELSVALREYGLEAGERVAFLGDPGPDATVVLLAAARAGATAVLLDPALSAEDLAVALKSRSVGQAVAGDDGRLRQLLAIRADLPDLELVLVARPDPSDRPMPALGVEAACYVGAAVLEQDPSASAGHSPFDPVVEIVGSGGSESVWSHAALLSSAERLAARLALGSRDTVLSSLPVAHEDLVPLTAACLSRGAGLVFDARAPFAFANLAEFAATVAVIGPSELEDLGDGLVAAANAKSWAGRKLHAWAVRQGRDRDSRPRSHRIAEALVLRDLRGAAGPALRLIQVLGASSDLDVVATLRAVGFTLACPSDGAA